MVYYAVAKGRARGIYSDWNSCKEQVNGYSGASFKKFSTAAEANQFVNSGGHSSGRSTYSGSGYSSSSGSSSGSSSRSSSRSSSNSFYSGGSSYPGGRGGSHVSKPAHNSRSYHDHAVHLDYHDSMQTFNISNPSSSESKTKVWIDGASRGNGLSPMPDSGYGVYYGPNDPKNAAVALNKVDDVKVNRPTNQRAELFAMSHALKDIRTDLEKGNKSNYEIITDSSYAKSCIDTWSDVWEQNDWKTSTKKSVANRDIIEVARKDYQSIKSLCEANGAKVEFTHVRGHQGDVGNENADRLANLGADAMRESKR